MDDICKLAKEFYPLDFTSQASGIVSKIDCKGKVRELHCFDRLIHLILTVLVSTASMQRSFSATKKIKIEVRNKMDYGFLPDGMTQYIERESVKIIDFDSIVDEFYVAGPRLNPF